MSNLPWGYDSLKAGTATKSGTSQWLRIDQKRISDFGEVSLDPDPMHVDPEWSARESPFGTTIAFGFLTMSLLTALLRDALGSSAGTDPSFYPLNYGFDRLRLIAPVPVDSRIRGRFELLEAKERKPGQLEVRLDVCIEIEGQERPALVAEWLTVFVRQLDAPHQQIHSDSAPASG